MKWIGLTLVAACVLGMMSGSATSQDRGLAGLIGELEALLAAEKAKTNHDRALVKKLEGIIGKFKGNSGGGGGSGDETPRGGSGRGQRGGNGASGAGWIIDRVLGDVEMTPEERAAVTRILTEFYTSWRLVRDNRDMESYPEIQRDRNNRLAKAIGQKRARTIIDVLDPMIDRWNRWGGRGR
jgi:hypothetical protein